MPVYFHHLLSDVNHHLTADSTAVAPDASSTARRSKRPSVVRWWLPTTQPWETRRAPKCWL